jgi:heat shock protein HslJ
MRSARWTKAFLGAFACALAVSASLTGCASVTSTTSPDPQLKGTWHLVVATNHGSTIRSGAEEITLTIADGTHSGGASPCSTYRASVTGGIGAVFINASVLDRDADCSDPALLHIDEQYLAALDSTTVASIDDGVLVLSSPHSSLVFIKPTASSLGTLQNTTWSLIEPPNLRDSTSVRMRFGSSNQLTITTPCSVSIATYELVEDIIILRGVTTTRTGGHSCTAVDLAASAVLTGQLTADVSSATIDGPATMILTNRATELPMLWRGE